MTAASTDVSKSEHSGADLPPALADYADRLLLGTGLNAVDAVLIASGRLEPPAELSGLTTALDAGWFAEEGQR
jgi:hypothetical protein